MRFRPTVDKCLSCEDIARQICAMVPRRRIFDDFLRPVFAASRVQHVSNLHPKFALRPHHCVEVWYCGLQPKSLSTAALDRAQWRTTCQSGIAAFEETPVAELDRLPSVL